MPGPVAEPASDGRTRWDTRIARARALAAESSSSSANEVLTFYAGLAERQRDHLDAADIQQTDSGDRAFREALDIEPALASIPGLLSWLTAHAPKSLAESARTLQLVEPARWRTAMHEYISEESDPADETAHATEFVVAASLQPFAEDLAICRHNADPAAPETAAGGPASQCPVCDGPPLVGVLREEGHGGRRALVCSFCLSEYAYRRVVCPACAEQRFDALPIYSAETFAHIRIDGCDTCRTYIKTIDLTKDGLAEPIVDDIASVTMDLWARERGYQRLKENLLRL